MSYQIGQGNVARNHNINNSVPQKPRMYKTLDDLQIQTYFPIKQFTEKQKLIFDHHMCMVCLVDFEHGEDIRKVLLCKHIFHSDCLLMWLKKEENCPLCKHGLSKADCYSHDIKNESVQNLEKMEIYEKKNTSQRNNQNSLSHNSLSDDHENNSIEIQQNVQNLNSNNDGIPQQIPLRSVISNNSSLNSSNIIRRENRPINNNNTIPISNINNSEQLQVENNIPEVDNNNLPNENSSINNEQQLENNNKPEESNKQEIEFVDKTDEVSFENIENN